MEPPTVVGVGCVLEEDEDDTTESDECKESPFYVMFAVEGDVRLEALKQC